jgi:hypothetical protein
MAVMDGERPGRQALLADERWEERVIRSREFDPFPFPSCATLRMLTCYILNTQQVFCGVEDETWNEFLTANTVRVSLFPPVRRSCAADPQFMCALPLISRF